MEEQEVVYVPKADYLARLNAHPRDANITFEEAEHIYTINGERGTYMSCTTWNHAHFGHFDADAVIGNIVRKWEYRNDPKYKYYGMTPEQIKQSWNDNCKAASTAGTKMHFDIECYYNNLSVENESIEFQYFRNFLADWPQLEAYRTEWMVYDEEHKLCGSIDMVFRDKETGVFHIYDWKRAREITDKSFGGKCAKTECISHLPDSNYWHYALQLNTYKHILERNYGIKIEGDLCLIVLHPNNEGENYIRIKLPVLSKEIDDLFEFRRNMLVDPEHFVPGKAPEMPPPSPPPYEQTFHTRQTFEKAIAEWGR